MGLPAAVATSRKRRAWVGWGLAGALAVTTALLTLAILTRQEPAPVLVAAEITVPDDVDPVVNWSGGSFALSPDGTQLAFSGVEEGRGVVLWVRDMANGEVRKLNGTESAFYPFWSPDGRHIAFFAGGKLMRVEANGGSAVTLCEVPGGRGGSWNRDGLIIYGKSTNDGIYAVPDGGGTPRAITTPDTAQSLEDNRFPWFLPDGEHFLFTARGTDAAFLCVGSLTGDSPKQILPIRSNGMYAAGNILYARGNTLVARPFDLGSLEFTGEPRIVVEPVNRSDGYAHGSFSVSNTGVLIYGTGGQNEANNIKVVNRTGNRVAMVETEGEIDDIVASQDGSMLAMMRGGTTGSGVDVWTYDLERRVFTRVTFEETCDDPVFSPDGNTIAYSGNGNIMSRRASGVGQPTEIYSSKDDLLPVDWARDGTRLMFLAVTAETREDVWIYDFSTEKAEPLLNSVYREMHAQFSPDGKWIAYASDESGDLQVNLIDFPGLVRKVQVTRSGGKGPRWRADGRELYFVAPDSIASVSVDLQGDRVILGEPKGMFPVGPSGGRTHQYAVSPDGESFYLHESALSKENAVFMVLVGWPHAIGLQ